MSTKSQIESVLIQSFSPDFLEVRDVSKDHAGHVGASPLGETHFEIDIVSAAFAGKSRIESHRMIHALLQPLLDSTVHALALNVKH
ncbi:BolA family transcriptional regulator [Alphaproteobacteria bacterium]|nr:BolA family transcriptional regulator [Alphaproteobacteria bacterium]